jgi:mono/diheme cytochrome c family protein
MGRWLWMVALGALSLGVLALAGTGLSQTPSDAPADDSVSHLEHRAEGTGAAPVVAAEPQAIYIVDTVIGCAGCHTPHGPEGLETSRWMAGMPVFMDLAPDDDAIGAIPSPNLTSDATGLGGWSDDQIRRAITQGQDEDGGALFPIMPYWIYHHLSPADADAMLAYLRAVPAVAQEIPDRQPLPMPFEAPVAPLADDMIPRSTLADDDPRAAAAERGRYLSTLACLGCHTAPAEDGPLPVQVEPLFAGGRSFGAPTGEVVSTNLTPHEHGLGDWTAEEVATALLEGRDRGGRGICAPMPSGPQGHFGQLTAEDALAIGTYLTTIPAVDNGELPDCHADEVEGDSHAH